MKALRIFYGVLVLLVFGSVTAQDKLEKAQTSIENLLNSKSFEFIANTAIPLSGPTKNLVGSGYSITFTPEMIISNMPFYGRAYSGMVLGRDKGMRFKGKPENFTVTNTKKGYEIIANVESENDTYVISISTGTSGFATLTISSNNRGAINYQGEIVNN